MSNDGGFAKLTTEEKARLHEHRMSIRDSLGMPIDLHVAGWGDDQGLTEEQQQELLLRQSNI